GEKEEVSLRYSSQLLKKPMDVLLEEALERDKIMGYTTVGIHRDDIKMSIMDYPIRRYGSQGQQKSFLIALKLAQYDILFAHVGRKPILLLDDIFDKLDLERVAELIGIVSGDHFGQIFISDCNKQRLKTILDKIDTKHKIFDIE
ncbi:MAG: DNA replication and repair protein RecF, partial [Rikenellaceae bacterium]